MDIRQDWSSRWALYSPQKVAIREYETGRTLTYGALDTQAGAVAAVLQSQYGLRKGDRVAVLMEFCMEYVALFAAVQKTGFILVPLNYRLSAPEIAYLLTNAEPSVLIVEPKFEYLISADVQVSTASVSTLADWMNSGQLLSETTQLHGDDPLFILYTSGTTGFPKGALYTVNMLFWNSINTAMSLIINQESRTLNFMPPFHTGGWNVLLTPFLHHGAYTCLLKKFDARAVLQLLQEERCTLFMGVPTMLKMMAELPEFEQAAFPDLYYAIVGGEPMPIPLIERWHAKGVMIRQGYGMTEVGPNLTSLHHHDAIRKKGSIGRPNFYVETRIVDDNRQPAEQGELLLRGPMVTPGYWRNAEATAKAFEQGWFCTGDRVRRDEAGYLFVIDRLKNMFISGGENVYPAEIERVLLGYPAVSEAAVIGVPDEKWGEVGKAFVVLHPDAQATAEVLIEYLQQHLARFKIPRYVVFIAALPKTDTGKIDKKKLT